MREFKSKCYYLLVAKFDKVLNFPVTLKKENNYKNSLINLL